MLLPMLMQMMIGLVLDQPPEELNLMIRLQMKLIFWMLMLGSAHPPQPTHFMCLEMLWQRQDSTLGQIPQITLSTMLQTEQAQQRFTLETNLFWQAETLELRFKDITRTHRF